MPDYASTADDELVIRAKSGNMDAFDALVSRHRRMAYRLAFAMTQSHDRADDISQETFVLAYRWLRQLRDPGRFVPWLKKILVNLCIRHASRQNSDYSLQCLETVQSHDNPESEFQRKVQRDSVRFAIMQLQPEERAVILLYYMEGLKQTEIADLIGCPVGTVWSRLSTARNKLRDLLSDLV